MFIWSLKNVNSLDNVECQTIKASRIKLSLVRNIDDNQEYTDSSNFDEQQKEQESENLKLNSDESTLDFQASSLRLRRSVSKNVLRVSSYILFWFKN
jgi:hypothetical protein